MSQAHPYQAAEIIQKRCSLKPRIGIVLGSGLKGFADCIENQTAFSYEDLPGFPRPSVKGHSGKLILGTINGTPVACLQGRAHPYEGDVYANIKTYVRTLKLIGCDIYLATNAAGGINPTLRSGDLMLVTDHINFQPGNPLAGPNEDEVGPRFPPLDKAYDPHLNELFIAAAKNSKIELQQGVYIAVLGPSYETTAEIKAFRTLGADAIGMSTVPEVIIANHCGLRVAVISIITNMATGLATESHDHENVLKVAEQAEANLSILITETLKQLS